MHNAPRRWMRPNKGEVNFKMVLILCAVLAGMGLVFFTVLSMWLFLGFVWKRVLITQSFSHLHRAKACSAPYPTPPHQWGGWEGDTRVQSAHSWDSWPKGYPIPYAIMLSIYVWEKKEERMFGVMDLCFLRVVTVPVLEHCFLRVGWKPPCS